VVDLGLYLGPRLGEQVCNNGACQCVALANDWCDANGWPRPAGATAGGLSFPAGWIRLSLSEAQPGDLIEWQSSLPGSDGDGHIAVYVQPLSPGFRSADQNWSCACSKGPCPCVCLIDHQDQVSDLPYVAGAWRWEGNPPPVEPFPWPGPASWPSSGYDLTGMEL
jgi:hypothetical protein